MSEGKLEVPETLEANFPILSAEEKELAVHLVEHGQSHLFQHWPAPGEKDEDKKRLLAQALKLDNLYPGGLKQYVANSRKLLEASRLGLNPFDGYTPEVPHGQRLTTDSAEFAEKERLGMEHIKDACFVLVAGGLGERLGYNGIKLELRVEISTETCYLNLYIQHILAFQQRAREVTQQHDLLLPLAIMTSGDTHERTVKLLNEFNNFGMLPEQITIVKQELVPAIMDATGRFALSERDPYEISVKPHGHGDVHTLLHQSGLVSSWVGQGKKWVIFFQDTNGIVFHSVPAALGVSVSEGFHVNSLTVPRKPGEAVGGICTLRHRDGHAITINVEYNQLDPLLRATISPQGDVPDPATGFSPYPGNINVLIFAAEPYSAVLQRTGGAVPEFVNPKYKDAAKTIFTPTRLECMMQDYPKLLGEDAKVGFTELERWICFSAVKNNVTDAIKKQRDTGFAESAASGEADFYALHRRKLAMANATIEPEHPHSYAGIQVLEGAHVVVAPQFAASLGELKQKLEGSQVHISARSTLVIEARHLTIRNLQLDGTLLIQAHSDAHVTIENLRVQNDGWHFVDIQPTDPSQPERYRIRGYVLEKRDQRVIKFEEPGQYVISE